MGCIGLRIVSIFHHFGSLFDLAGFFRLRIWLPLFFSFAMRWVIAHFEALCAEIWPFKNIGVNLGLFRALLEAFVA